MQLSFLKAGVCLALLGEALAAHNIGYNVFKRHEEIKARHDEQRSKTLPRAPVPEKRQTSSYLTDKTKPFAVDGTKFPNTTFDIGESYSGYLPISDDPNETRELFFWFFPSQNPAASEEVVIWLNGGPGCSSLSGLLTENGPFLWQAGTLAPVLNTYSWTNLTNMLWIEQPVGVGYSRGNPNITNEQELGVQFRGFYKNFVDTFDAHGKGVYITGESYAGFYVPYIADSFIEANDLNYYNLKGVGINDPILGSDTVGEQIVAVPFVEEWSQLFYFNQTFMDAIKAKHEECGYADYLDKYYKFPPPAGSFPDLEAPSEDNNYNCDLFDDIYFAVLEINPCFNIYHITDTCPHPYSVLGIINEGDYQPVGAVNYFNQSDVKAALHADPDVNWLQCSTRNVFNFGYENNYTLGDTSPGPAVDGTLQRVIEYTNNTLIGSGRLDYILPPKGTILQLNNVTWNGAQGFSQEPDGPQSQDFYVPYHPETNQGRLSEAGFVGKWTEERGLTFYTVQLSGHELPGYAAGAGYRMLELLLGRIDNLGVQGDFTTQTGNFTGNSTIYKRDTISERFGRLPY